MVESTNVRSSYVIACDESGAEGENLLEATHSVFTHASTDLAMEAAAEFISELRQRIQSQAPEFKSEQLRKPKARSTLLWMLGEDSPLSGHACVELVDKEYFVVGKVIDLLVEEVAHEAGVDLYTSYDTRQMAWTLHREGHRAFGSERWLHMLTSFNSLMRAKQRNGIKTSVDDFFNTLDQLRFKSRRRNVDDIINVMWQARGHAQKFQESLAGGRSQAPALDPLFACLPQTARFWFVKVRQVIDVVHDEQVALTEERIKAMQLVLARLPRTHPGHVLIGDVHQVNSRSDPRVQVADLLAGAAREIAAKELARSGNAELTNLLRPFVDPWSIWSDKRSTDRSPRTGLLVSRVGVSFSMW